MLIDDLKEDLEVITDNADALQEMCNSIDRSGSLWDTTSVDARNAAFHVLNDNLRTITNEVVSAYKSVALVRHLETDDRPRMDDSIDRFLEEVLASLDRLADRVQLLAEVEDILDNSKESE